MKRKRSQYLSVRIPAELAEDVSLEDVGCLLVYGHKQQIANGWRITLTESDLPPALRAALCHLIGAEGTIQDGLLTDYRKPITEE